MTEEDGRKVVRIRGIFVKQCFEFLSGLHGKLPFLFFVIDVLIALVAIGYLTYI